MSDHDFDAYGFGVMLGLASYQLSASYTPEDARRPLILDALSRAREFGQRVGSIVEGIDVSRIDHLVSRMNDKAPNFLHIHDELADLRDHAYSNAIFNALPRFGFAYVLGANMAIAEGEVSYYASDEFAEAARKIAIHGLLNSQLYIDDLKGEEVVLDRQWIDELLAMFTAGKPNSEIHPRVQTYRVAYGEALQQASFPGGPTPKSAKLPPPMKLHLPPLVVVPKKREAHVSHR
jgi:hypothetical protein